MRHDGTTMVEALRSPWSRRLAAFLGVCTSFALVVSLAPARSRDRGGSRSSAARAGSGSQRWDIHHDDGELPLHVTTADWYQTHVLTADTVTGPEGADTPASAPTAFLRDDGAQSAWEAPGDLASPASSPFPNVPRDPARSRGPPGIAL